MLGSVDALCVDEVYNYTSTANYTSTTCGSSFTYFFYPSFLLISSILVCVNICTIIAIIVSYHFTCLPPSSFPPPFMEGLKLICSYNY